MEGLKSYAVFISDHTGKEDKFFEIVEEKGSLSMGEHTILIKHYERCRKDVGGRVRMEQIVKLIEYLEEREWMKRIYLYYSKCQG